MTKDNNTSSPKGTNSALPEELIVSIFAAAGYEFMGQSPKGRMLFWHNPAEERVDFLLGDETDLTKVMLFICQRAYDLGESWGKHLVRNEIKKALGLTQLYDKR